MTLLFTQCPYCGSNLMLLNTADLKGDCITCSKMHDFTESQVKEAEVRRDSLSDKYLPRVQKAFESNDIKDMKAIADELVQAGVSSWYAWMCLGWLDLQEGNTGVALDDLNMAASFLDEENYDEFYEKSMEFILDSMLESSKEGKTWFSEDVSMVTFTGNLFERFGHFQEEGDFVHDLLKRMATLEDDLDKRLTGMELISEIALCILDYYSCNTYVGDHQEALNNAISSIEVLQSKVESMKDDGSINKQIVANVGPGYISFMKELLEFEDSMADEFTEDQLFGLCSYWASNDYQEVYEHFQDAFGFHMDVATSGGRNKGAVKKKDAAMSEYKASFRRPLDEGLVSDEEEGDVDFDRICPECGEYLKADDTGMMRCECGFKSRMVTKAILDLPDDIGKLVPMIRKAMDEDDPVMLNNLGEKILSIDENDWHGSFAIAESCIIDSEFGEATMMFVQAAETVGKADAEQFREDVIRGLNRMICGFDDSEQLTSAVMMPMLLDSLYLNDDKSEVVPRLLSEIMKISYEDLDRGFLVSILACPLVTVHFMHCLDPSGQKQICLDVLGLIDKIETDAKASKDDDEETKTCIITTTRFFRDALTIMIDGFDSKASDLKDAGYITGYWSAKPEEYDNLVATLSEALAIEDTSAYNPKSNAVQKSFKDIRNYIDLYSKAGRN